MFTVSLIGPDGVGKTTIAKQLEMSFPLPIKYLYMGTNAGSSNYMLPTTRWWANRKLKSSKVSMKSNAVEIQSKHELLIDHKFSKGKSEKLPRLRKLLDAGTFRIRRSVGFINRILEEWYRQLIAYSYARRGYIVIFDRHFTYDYYHYNYSSLKGKMHGFLAKHTFPKPDLVICLDAPGEVVFKRKGEFTPDLLELRRTQYLSLKAVIQDFAVVNADRKLKLVVQDVSDLIYQFYRRRQDSAQKK